jgi:DNA polymerase epsilon subunit 1
MSQLVAEFRRMGAVIVYANLSRIILSTRKNTVPDAINYLEFVVSSVKNKELFHSIGLKFENCWQHLLWLGPVSISGIELLTNIHIYELSLTCYARWYKITGRN